MQTPSAGNLPSLSATSPTNDITEKPLNGFHDATKPFTSPESLPKAHRKPITIKTNEASMQAAKREIHSKLREDWTWPPTSTQADKRNLPDSDKAWRERDSDSSYSPLSPELEHDPYKFDSPDSLAEPVLSRKRKRQQLLEEEMKWNEGLQTYIERRDAWSGARTQALSPSINSPYTPPDANTNGTITIFPPTPDSPTLPTASHLSTYPPPPPSSPMSTALVPLAPPILPLTNPTRASIQPSTYPAIYSKVIVQGLTPSVPINLKDVVSALVQGWKKDGEWPPKTEAEKAAGAGQGGLGVGGVDGPTMPGLGRNGEGRKAVRRSVGRVKKALGLGLGIDGPARGEGRMEE
ncbi:hypothetical protein OEA41_006425 [Lepraria neglecta]|uniref:Gag1-like clamp domain-containing protein n=1 Tax=Lepraria neglecta TaxID=209136 RepID=A0AAE0DKK8_9LECA|nr:hypothetical protein OEA41_006425 [Lepraria neglecta]